MKKTKEMKPQYEVQYQSTIIIPVEEKAINIVTKNMKQVNRIIKEMYFKKVKKPKDAHFAIAKSNPIISYSFEFYNKKIVARAFTFRVDAIKEFEEVTKTEIMYFFNQINAESKKPTYIC